MMKIELLSPIIEAIASGTLPIPVVEAVQRWDGQIHTATHIRSSSNHVFKFARADNWYFLRLTPIEKRPKAQIAGELDFVHQLANKGVPVAQPLQSLANHYIEQIDWGEHGYYAVVFAGLPGRQWSDPADLPSAMVQEWGGTLAQLHRASQSLTSSASLCRPSWKDTLDEAGEWLPAEEKLAHYELAAVREWLISLPVDACNYGLIHRDLELDNLIWDGQRFQILDFDDCVYHWYVADIAAALDEVWLNPKLEHSSWLHRFLEGYTAVLDNVKVQMFDLRQFLRCIRVLDFAQVLYAYQTTPQGPAPAWLTKQRKRSKRWLTARRKSFAGGVM